MNNKRLHMLNNELGLKDFKKAPNPKNIIKNVNNKINSNPVERNIFVKRKLFGSALIAALILLIASLTVIAATFGWHRKLIENFNNPTAKQIQQTDGAIGTPMIKKTDGDVTVNVIQTLADNHGIYVLYEVELQEDVKPNENISWEKERLKIQYNNADKKIGNGGYAYSKIIDKEKNKYTVLYIRTGVGEIKNQKLSFELEGLKKVYLFPNEDKAEYEKISNCKFNFEWDFEYVNSGTTWNINQKIYNGKNTITDIDISPISLWITVKGDRLDNIKDIKIQFYDGHTITVTNKEYVTQYTPLYDGINTISYEFNEIVTVNDISEITIGDKTIKVNRIKRNILK